MYYSGIDQHERDSFITTYDSNGTVVKQMRVKNKPLLIQSYFAQFPGPHKAVVESTGSWYWLADLLQKHNVELTLAHATRLKAISAAKVKIDKVDSDILAVLLRAGLIPEAHKSSTDMRGPRDLMRTRLRLISKCTGCKNSIERLLEKFNVTTITELDDLYQLQAKTHEAQIALLEQQIKTIESTLHSHLIPNEDSSSSLLDRHREGFEKRSQTPCVSSGGWRLSLIDSVDRNAAPVTRGWAPSGEVTTTAPPATPYIVPSRPSGMVDCPHPTAPNASRSLPNSGEASSHTRSMPMDPFSWRRIESGSSTRLSYSTKNNPSRPGSEKVTYRTAPVFSGTAAIPTATATSRTTSCAPSMAR